MDEMSSFGTIALTRVQALQVQYERHRDQAQENGNTSIELPAAITNLITGPEFWIVAKTNRYRKLVREGHLHNLLELAAIALTKRYPAHWFAKVCSVRSWERTLDFLRKLYTIREKAERVVTRIGKDINEGMRKFVYKQLWMGKSIERYAVTAQERGKHRYKLFAYLCMHEE